MRCRNIGDTSGVYHCDIETNAVHSSDNTARECQWRWACMWSITEDIKWCFTLLFTLFFLNLWPSMFSKNAFIVLGQVIWALCNWNGEVVVLHMWTQRTLYCCVCGALLSHGMSLTNHVLLISHIIPYYTFLSPLVMSLHLMYDIHSGLWRRWREPMLLALKRTNAYPTEHCLQHV